jgi:hypothetical protein
LDDLAKALLRQPMAQLRHLFQVRGRRRRDQCPEILQVPVRPAQRPFHISSRLTIDALLHGTPFMFIKKFREHKLYFYKFSTPIKQGAPASSGQVTPPPQSKNAVKGLLAIA